MWTSASCVCRNQRLHLHHAPLITTRRCCCAPPRGCTLRPPGRARWPSTRCVPVREVASALSLLNPDMACHWTPGKPAYHKAFECTYTTAAAGFMSRSWVHDACVTDAPLSLWPPPLQPSCCRMTRTSVRASSLYWRPLQRTCWLRVGAMGCDYFWAQCLCDPGCLLSLVLLMQPPAAGLPHAVRLLPLSLVCRPRQLPLTLVRRRRGGGIPPGESLGGAGTAQCACSGSTAQLSPCCSLAAA